MEGPKIPSEFGESLVNEEMTTRADVPALAPLQNRESASTPETLLNPEELEYFYNRSRLLFFGMPQTAEFMKERRTSPGQKVLYDTRSIASRNMAECRNLQDIGPQIDNSFKMGQGVLNLIREKEIHRAIAVTPLIDREQVTIEVTEGGFFSKKIIVKETGEFKETPRQMSKFSDNPNTSSEPAYALTYYIVGTPNQEFTDVTTNRAGRMARFSLVLPEGDAKILHARVSENPHILDQIFAQIDPQLMEDQSTGIPIGDKIFIKPLDGEPYEFDLRNPNKVIAIKEECIHEY